MIELRAVTVEQMEHEQIQIIIYVEDNKEKVAFHLDCEDFLIKTYSAYNVISNKKRGSCVIYDSKDIGGDNSETESG